MADSGFAVAQRTFRSLDDIDRMPGDLRACVHEYGYAIVYTLRKFGITKPAHIHEIVREIWAGARSSGQTSVIPAPLMKVEWLLQQRGCEISSKTLWRLLFSESYAIVPIMPTRLMLDASMAEISGFNERVTKEEKHRRRWVATVKAHCEHINRQIAVSA